MFLTRVSGSCSIFGVHRVAQVFLYSLSCLLRGVWYALCLRNLRSLFSLENILPFHFSVFSSLLSSFSASGRSLYGGHWNCVNTLSVLILFSLGSVVVSSSLLFYFISFLFSDTWWCVSGALMREGLCWRAGAVLSVPLQMCGSARQSRLPLGPEAACRPRVLLTAGHPEVLQQRAGGWDPSSPRPPTPNWPFPQTLNFSE